MPDELSVWEAWEDATREVFLILRHEVTETALALRADDLGAWLRLGVDELLVFTYDRGPVSGTRKGLRCHVDTVWGNDLQPDALARSFVIAHAGRVYETSRVQLDDDATWEHRDAAHGWNDARSPGPERPGTWAASRWHRPSVCPSDLARWRPASTPRGGPPSADLSSRGGIERARPRGGVESGEQRVGRVNGDEL